MSRIAFAFLGLGAAYLAWHVGLYLVGMTPDEFLDRVRDDILRLIPDLTLTRLIER